MEKDNADRNDNGKKEMKQEEAEIAATTSSSSEDGSQDGRLERLRTASDGRWGEQDGGGAVDVESAISGFEELRESLSRESQQHQKKAHDLESGRSDNIDLKDYLTRNDDLLPRKTLGLSFRNLTVHGFGTGWILAPTFTGALLDIFGYGLLQMAWGYLKPSGPAPAPKHLISDFSGVVRAGEMLLVLGRPGSGSSTFLRALTNQPRSFTQVSGDLKYGGLSYGAAAGRFRGEILLNQEDDTHMATLTVDQTLKFALRTKTPRTRTPGTTRQGFVEQMAELLVDVFKMRHVRDTIVGDAFTRGVSGGERKRVSIMEALASRAAVNAWDNSTRGLDHVSAQDYIRSLRILNLHTASTTVVTLYQAGEGIYNEFDKVCLIDEGRQIFFGKASEARAYFEGLGYEAAPRITTADFLTTITDPNGRVVKAGWEQRVPRTPKELEDAFRNSRHWRELQEELQEFENEVEKTGEEGVKEFEKTVVGEKSGIARKKSPYTVSFPMQVGYLTQREFLLQWQDRTTLQNTAINIIVIGLLCGALFYDIQPDSQGAFLYGGALFFNIIIVGWMQMIEAIKMTTGRAIAGKQTAFGFYRPSAIVIARSIADLPMITITSALFTIILYWMANLWADAGKFFIHLLFVVTTTICMTALYRAIGAFSMDVHVSIRYVFFVLNVTGLFSGYMQPYRTMGSWVYKWIFWATPLSYAQEAVMTNQLSGRVLQCTPMDLVPNIPGVDIANQVCALVGAEPGSATVSGDRYLHHYSYSHSHLWRNFGIIIAFTVAYLVVAMIGVEYMNFGAGGGSIKLLTKKPANGELPTRKPEAQTITHVPTNLSKKTGPGSELARTRSAASTIKTDGSVYTWTGVNYTIGGKKLLNNINGYVKPGRLTALVGASGAGKTTLLDNLAMRKRQGVTEGTLRLDGKLLMPDFERSTAFVEQQDVHDWSATVREALRFSAMLRQPKTVSKEQKYAFVEELIQLLELEHLADALIGMPGFGLSIEERKRVTIGVELASAPAALMFLDEPTSGLDSTGALSIIRFLRKLADESNIAILCTIHQPSGILFREFDDVLVLSHGEQVYFGELGTAGKTVISYFRRNGAPAPPADMNPAEYILESTATPRGWAEAWRNSPESQSILEEIETHIHARSGVPETRTLRTLAYAMPLLSQITTVTKRTLLHYHRNPSYGYSKLFSNLSMSLLGGTLFFGVGNTLGDLQSRAFAVFIILIMCPMLFTAIQPNFLEFRALYETRERNSKIYSAPAWLTAVLLAEIPYAVLGSVFLFLPWYYMVGFPTASTRAGYAYFLLLLYQLWIPPIAMFVAAICKDMAIIAVVNPFFFIITTAVTGILVPYPILVAPFKHFVYWANPLTYLVRGMLSNAIHGVKVVCEQDELVLFYPPSGESCESFAGGWISGGANGYVSEMEGGCGYCSLKNGDEFLAGVGVEYSTRWRDLGILAAFVVSNTVLVYVLYWVVREVRWRRFWKK